MRTGHFMADDDAQWPYDRNYDELFQWGWIYECGAAGIYFSPGVGLSPYGCNMYIPRTALSWHRANCAWIIKPD
jgi:hypothetical protein